MIVHLLFFRTHSEKNAASINLNPFLVLLFILQLVACPLWGQVLQKKQLSESDYALFGELLIEKTSTDGKWISYRMSYDNGVDTLFVRNTTTLKTYNFPQGTFPVFAGNSYIICKDSKQRYIQNLDSGQRSVYPLKTKIEYASASNFITILFREQQSLQLLDLKSSKTETIQSVTDFKLSPSGRMLLLSSAVNKKYAIGYVTLKAAAHVKWLIQDSNLSFSGLKWDELSGSISFFSFSEKDPTDACLYLYILKSKKLHALKSSSPPFPSGRIFDKNFTYPLEVSPDLQRVFFSLLPKKAEALKNKDSVEIWKTNDKWIYPLERSAGRFSQKAALAVWQPFDGRLVQITSSQLPKVMLNGDKSYAILSNPQQYEPQFEENGSTDFYLMNLKTGKTEILSQKHSAYYGDLIPSPSGRYIASFKDNNWWIYDIYMRKEVNITKSIDGSFSMKSRNENKNSAYGTAGWSEGEKYIIVYDQFDIWLITPDGSSFKKITDGEKQKIRFRINSKGSYDLITRNYDGFKSSMINLSGGLILQAQGQDGKTGFYLWNRNSGTVPVVYGDQFIDKIEYIAEKELYFFRQQRYDMPPSIVAKKKNTAEQFIFKSNPNQQQYYWGRSELVTFTNSKGKNFKGILYYPSDYKAGKKYPMIVHIYEKQSSSYNHFIVPSLYMPGGYNAAVFSSKGYFVLCPDIEQETGKVGEKALDCTISAVNQVIERGLVLPDKIGLIGHSFGAYESNYIITQTDLFAAAVSGAGVSDLHSFYLNIGWDLNISDMTRFESGQWRMGTSLFDNPELYTVNSPITHAARIKTPILIWAGKADWHVNWNQSVEFYMALRRLGKTGTMLLYPNEKHTIMQRTNQKDLSRHIHEWFEYYLKNKNAAPWIGS